MSTDMSTLFPPADAPRRAPRPAGALRGVAAVAACLLVSGAWAAGPVAAAGAASLATAPAEAMSSARGSTFEGRVEAVRQSVISAQVAGEVVELPVHAGERVAAGRLLARLDARAADQQAGAAAAQVQAARAAQEASTKEYERQKTLFQKNYISQAALERAEAQFKAAQAEAAAQLAAAGAARSQTGWYTLSAPYAGIVSEVSVVRGDMALPGRPLLTLYDPAALRVSAQVPQSTAARLPAGGPVAIEIAGAASSPLVVTRWEWLPAVDPASHTRELRAELPPGTDVAPGSFARGSLPGAPAAAAPNAAEPARVAVPARAVVRRAELVAVYVVGADGRPLLRQVRLGRADGDRVELLSGVSAGERVALDPQAAARVR